MIVVWAISTLQAAVERVLQISSSQIDCSSLDFPVDWRSMDLLRGTRLLQRRDLEPSDSHLASVLGDIWLCPDVQIL